MTTKSKQTVYMKIGESPMYLPEAIADSVKDLAKITGYTPGSISSEVSRYNRHGKIGRFIRVVIDDDED